MLSNVLNQFDGQQFSLTVTCSKGTYIRNLVEDIGAKLRVGAHVTRLHRCYSAGFMGERMYSLDELQSSSHEELMTFLLPIDKAVSHFPHFSLSAADTLALLQGKIVQLHPNAMTGCVRLYENDTKFVGLGEINTNGQLKAKRLVANTNR